MAFHLGSLGFLTPFKFDTYQSQVTQIIEGKECSLPCLSASGFLQHNSLLICLQVKSSLVFIYRKNIFVSYIGNAAIVLRSRLKVRVLKENWEKKARVDEKGIILTNGDIENSRKAMQYQVISPP